MVSWQSLCMRSVPFSYFYGQSLWLHLFWPIIRSWRTRLSRSNTNGFTVASDSIHFQRSFTMPCSQFADTTSSWSICTSLKGHPWAERRERTTWARRLAFYSSSQSIWVTYISQHLTTNRLSTNLSTSMSMQFVLWAMQCFFSLGWEGLIQMFNLKLGKVQPSSSFCSFTSWTW